MTTFRKFVYSVVALWALMAAHPAHAHFLWGEISSEAQPVARLSFADAPGMDSEEGMVGRIESARAWNGEGKVLSLETIGDVRTGSLQGSRVFGSAQMYGVLDKTKEGRGVFKVMYYAKSARSLKDAHRNLKLPFEMFARPDGADHIIVTVKRGAIPYENASLNVYEPGQRKWRPIVSDAKGEIRFESKPGLFGIKAAWVDETPGEVDGKKYPFIRNYSTLTFRVLSTSPR